MKAESIELFETNGRLIDKNKMSEFKKKLIKELERQEQYNITLLQNKLDRVKLADELVRQEEKIKEIQREEPNSKLIQILMEQLRADRELANQKMDMMWKAMEEQMERTRETMKNMDTGGGGGFCTIQ